MWHCVCTCSIVRLNCVTAVYVVLLTNSSGLALGELTHVLLYVSQTKVLVCDGLIQSHLVTRETSAGCVHLVSLPA